MYIEESNKVEKVGNGIKKWKENLVQIWYKNFDTLNSLMQTITTVSSSYLC